MRNIHQTFPHTSLKLRRILWSYWIFPLIREFIYNTWNIEPWCASNTATRWIHTCILWYCDEDIKFMLHIFHIVQLVWLEVAKNIKINSKFIQTFVTSEKSLAYIKWQKSSHWKSYIINLNFGMAEFCFYLRQSKGSGTFLMSCRPSVCPSRFWGVRGSISETLQ